MLEHLSQADLTFFRDASILAPIVAVILQFFFKSKWVKKEVVQLLLMFIMLIISVLRRIHKQNATHTEHLDTAKTELLSLRHKLLGKRVLG